MRLITTMLTLLLAYSAALAEWVKVDESENTVFYIDPATIRQEGDIRWLWIIQDLKKRDGEGGELSRRVQREFDCRRARHRIL